MPAQNLTQIANRLRADVLEMVHRSRAGHVAGPLSSAELFAALYFGETTKFDPRNPWWEERDRIVLSCGHYCPVLYAALARAGYFEAEELKTFAKLGSRLPAHPEYRCAPGVEVSSGPLGQGVSVAVGMATALKLKYGERPQAETPRVICLISDGEIEEGQVWEAINFAVRRQLDNLIFVLDRNKIQIENYTDQIVTYGEVAGRLEAFGLNVIETEGNDGEAVVAGLRRARGIQGAPCLIELHTTAGNGVSWMENIPEWHDRVPTSKELDAALKELNVQQ